MLAMMIPFVAAPGKSQGQGQGANPNSAGSIVQKMLAAYGSRWASGEITDWIADGKITYFNTAGEGPTFDVTLAHKGKSQIQRLVKQPGAEVRVGSDGSRSWDSLNGWFVAEAQGQAQRLIESQTIRSIPALLNYQTEGLTLLDAGKSGNVQLIEAEARNGRKTRYSIDDETSRVTKLEFITGQMKDALGNVVAATESFVFSDYRQVQGLLTPFKTERYINGIKAEEIQLSSVRYNASVKDDAFQP
jgi:hypothetical protein